MRCVGCKNSISTGRNSPRLFWKNRGECIRLGGLLLSTFLPHDTESSNMGNFLPYSAHAQQGGGGVVTMSRVSSRYQASSKLMCVVSSGPKQHALLCMSKRYL